MVTELITKLKILKPAHDIFEAFADPSKIGNFWFSTSSDRWEQGKKISLSYKEFEAVVSILITEIELDKKIVYLWGEGGNENTVIININNLSDNETIVEITEKGWDISDKNLVTKLIRNKEGWTQMLTCLKGYLENNINTLRTGLIFEINDFK